MLRLAGHWLWDFWLCRAVDGYHAFYLQAPRSLGDPELRHEHAEVGHARSTDLREWVELPRALSAGPEGEWDDRCIWTGNVLSTDTGYAMLYTGTNRREGGRAQRIGLARSEDLLRWRRHGSPVIDPEPTLYMGSNPVHGDECAWRDPAISLLPEGGYEALICAQVDDASGVGHGAIARALSNDWVHWRVGEPLLTHPGFFLMEVPQRAVVGEWEYLLFSAMSEWLRLDALPAGTEPVTGSYYFLRHRSRGDWEFGGRLCGSHSLMGYGFKLVLGDTLKGLYWLGYDRAGRFLGELADPVDVHQASDGRLDVTSTDTDGGNRVAGG